MEMPQAMCGGTANTGVNNLMARTRLDETSLTQALSSRILVTKRIPDVCFRQTQVDGASDGQRQQLFVHHAGLFTTSCSQHNIPRLRMNESIEQKKVTPPVAIRKSHLLVDAVG